jgi:hypothetical protein
LKHRFSGELVPEEIAEQIADLAMRALLAKPSALKGIKSRYRPDAIQ